MSPFERLFSLMLVPAGVSAFIHQPPLRSSLSRPASALHVGATLDWNAEQEDEFFLMQRAMECANSDSCSIDDARMCLDDVIHIQSGCVSGSVLGDVCQNVDDAVEVVASLRAKIEKMAKQALAVKTGQGVVGVVAVVAMLAALSSGLTAIHTDSTPFTPQEWWWSIRDGYFPVMLSHYFRHGGLETSSIDMETTPLCLQEWWWAVRDGYLPTILDHFFKNGGLSVSENYVTEAVAFTPNEWQNALRDGYLDRMISYNFQNGGLATPPADLASVSFTPQEVLWAVKGGYAKEMTEHFFRNGGL